jgi:PAS domain S-box-containing protein
MDSTLDQKSVLNVAIVGGGKRCKCFMDILFRKTTERSKLNLLGVADVDPEGEGYRYAREKGIFTTNRYHDLYDLKGLNIIIELTGNDEVAIDLSQTKPKHIRVMEHMAAALFVNLFLSQEERVAETRRIDESLMHRREERSRIQTLTSIIQATSIPTFVIDEKHRIIHWNVACENLTGIAGYEMLGTKKQWLAFYDQRRPVLADLIVDSASEEDIMKYYGGKCRRSTVIEGAYEAEDFFPDLGEQGKWLFFTAAPLRDADGEVTGGLETLQDISESKWAEEELKRYRDELEIRVERRTARLREANERLQSEIAERERMESALRSSERELRESQEKYKTLFDYTPNSIFVLEHDTFNIVDMNARALEIYGYDRREMIGKSFLELGNYVYPEGVLSKNANKEVNSVYSKLRHYKRDGTPFYVNVHAHKSKRSRKYGLVAVTVDITDTLAKESQLVQASKMSTLGEMAAAVAHELNQPLSAIMIGADILTNLVNEGLQGCEDLVVVSEHMKEQVDRASIIINHLRAFGRKSEIKKVKMSINKPIEGVFTLVGQQLKLHGITAVLELGEDLPLILGDVNRLEQVFLNLVVNARNAMEERKKRRVLGDVKSVLTVRSFEEDGYVVVTVSDTGTGIPDKIIDKIFEPFFTTKEVGKGTGLGLSISYSIIKDYDGVIEVESKEGKGATFKIRFPACKEEGDGE